MNTSTPSNTRTVARTKTSAAPAKKSTAPAKAPSKMPIPAPKAGASASAKATLKAPAKHKTGAKAAAKASTKTPTKLKQKPVRDSFTMPQADFDLIDALKQRALAFKRPVKKSELLRAGLHALTNLSDAQLRDIVDKLATLKPGRPKKAD